MKKYVTSESVTEGHPDKICDKISDKILDTALKIDKESKMAVECTIKDDLVFIYGEATTKAQINYEKIAKEVIKDIGYQEEYHVITKISEQSKEIHHAVCQKELAAGDQGIMFGYATNEMEDYMPLPSYLANKITKELSRLRKNDESSPLLPDGKSQVTVVYENNLPKYIDTIIISTQHQQDCRQEELKKYLIDNIVDKIIPKEYLHKKTKILINPSGSFTIGGSFGDSGTTGRKIVVDSYGGSSKVGGGCYSSKDPTKVDRSAAYYARYVAKNLVANNLCTKCEIGLSYAIGKPEPISISIEMFKTNKYPQKTIEKIVQENFDFKVSSIIKELNLLNIEYYPLAAYGHFGRPELNLPWEQIKKIKNPQ